MSLLLGGALVLITLSALSILLGWAIAEQALVYISIAFSAGVAVCLALAYARSRADSSGPRGARSGGGRRSPE